MKKFIRYLFFIGIIGIPLWSWLFWYFQTPKILDIFILDKTVPTLKRNEHRSFSWILKHHGFKKPDSTHYQTETDYYGFFPLEPIDSARFEIHDIEHYDTYQIDSLAQALDAVYFTDTYGVYYNEWYRDTLETEHSPKIYGGTTINEYQLLKRMKEQKKLILTEFNMLASPTSRQVRRKIERLFDIEWSGWTCRYFHTLDTLKNPELPQWVVRLYKQQHNNQWNFTKSGLVFVHENTTLEILENETHLEKEVAYLNTGTFGQEKYGLTERVHYPFWLDITDTVSNTNRVVSYYSIHTNQKGDSILNAHRIPKEFPAVIEHTDTYLFHYFAGDFADNPIHYNTTVYFQGIQWFDFMMYNDDVSKREIFFWTFYYPMIKTIFFEYHTGINSGYYSKSQQTSRKD